jgi:hypothetical protein
MSRFVALLAGTVLLCAAAPVTATPQWVRLATTTDASNSMRVAWTTIYGAPETNVKYGTVKGAYPMSVKGQMTYISSTLGVTSEALLTALKPDTTYYYRVGGNVGGWSPEYSFRTGPPASRYCGKLSVAVFGDSRAESWEGDKGVSNRWAPLVLAALKAHQPQVLMHGGDIVYDGTQQKQWFNHVKATSAFSPLVPIMYTLGNHDDGPGAGDKANYNALLNLPRADKALGGSGTEDYYYFTVGNAIFLVLSTETYSGGSPKFKNQADWMDRVLTKNPKRWKFAIMHRPIYTHRIGIFGLDISHPPNEAGHNAAFVPVFNKHHVDIVFGSHNHFYERFAPSNCKSAASTKPCPVSSPAKGTVYITTGGAGAFPLVCPLLCPGPTSSTRPAASSDHHYIILQIDDHKLSLKAINASGKTIDSYAITKSVPNPDPCKMPPPPDAGPPPDSAGPVADVSTLPDLQQAPDSAAPTGDSGQGIESTQEGCNCRLGRGGAGPAPAGTLLVLLALLALLALGLRGRRIS